MQAPSSGCGVPGKGSLNTNSRVPRINACVKETAQGYEGFPSSLLACCRRPAKSIFPGNSPYDESFEGGKEPVESHTSLGGAKTCCSWFHRKAHAYATHDGCEINALLHSAMRFQFDPAGFLGVTTTTLMFQRGISGNRRVQAGHRNSSMDVNGISSLP